MNQLRKEGSANDAQFEQRIDAQLVRLGSGDKGGDNGAVDELDRRVTRLEAVLETVLPTLATKTDVEGIKTEIARSELTVTRWVMGVALGVIALLLSTYATFFKPSATPIAASQPAAATTPTPAPPPK